MASAFACMAQRGCDARRHQRDQPRVVGEADVQRRSIGSTNSVAQTKAETGLPGSPTIRRSPSAPLSIGLPGGVDSMAQPLLRGRLARIEDALGQEGQTA